MSRGALLPHQSGLVSGRAGRSCGNNGRRLLAPGSRFGFGSVHLLSVVAHEIATLPQWPRINPHVGRILRTRHSPVTQKTAPNVARLLGLPPMSLPRFAASDDGHFAPGELPARHCRPVMLLAKSVPIYGKRVW